MFNLFSSNPSKKLQSKLAKLYEEAMHTQRSGDLKKYAFQMEAIAKLEKELEALHSQKN